MSEYSGFKEYSLAIVSTNKALNSNEIEATPHEHSPMVNGELSDNTSTYSASGIDSTGAAYQNKANTTTTVKAVWIPRGQSNRMTAPDVRRGTTVMLYKYGDAPTLYWDTLHNDIDNRKLETVIHGYSATSDESATPDETNTYIHEVSTHKKLLRWHIPESEGELTSYDITLDAKAGVFSYVDGLGNKITVDSGEKHLRLENGDGSYFEINKKIFNGYTAEEWNVKTKKYTLTADTITETASTSASLETPANSIKAQTSHDGDFGLGGDMSMYAGSSGGGGNNKMSGNTTIEGSLDVTGAAMFRNSVTVTGTLKAGQVVSSANVIAPNV